MATSKIPCAIKTKTFSATTTSTGAVALPNDVKAGFISCFANITSIAFRRDNDYIMVKNSETFAPIANTNVTITVKYVGGVIRRILHLIRTLISKTRRRCA